MKASAVTFSFTVLFAFSRMALLCVGLVGLAGCESMRTVIVNIDFDIQLTGRPSDGLVWRASAQEITKKRHPQAASPFANVHVESKLFEWRIDVSPRSVGYFLRSNIDVPICFRFDQATLTSNFQPKAVPLMVKRPRIGIVGGQAARLDINPLDDGYIVASMVCADKEKGASFGFVADFSTLYPNGQAFNINQSGKSLDYTEHGKGNWLKLNVPIEYAGKREEIEVTFTAINSIARYSYH
jgi:hypothetical protein